MAPRQHSLCFGGPESGPNQFNTRTRTPKDAEPRPHKVQQLSLSHPPAKYTPAVPTPVAYEFEPPLAGLLVNAQPSSGHPTEELGSKNFKNMEAGANL